MRRHIDAELAACRAELEGLYKPSEPAGAILNDLKRKYKDMYPDGTWRKAASDHDVIWTLSDRDGRDQIFLTVTPKGISVRGDGEKKFISVSSAQIGAWMQRVKPIARAPDCREYSIRTLCTNMYRDGYRWATLTRSTRLDFTEIDPTKGLGSGVKPDNVLYFSELVKGEDGAYLPYWYRFLDYEGGGGHPNLHHYLGGNIAFARFNSSDILQSGHPAMAQYRYDKIMYNWDAFKTQNIEFKGFLHTNIADPRYFSWDVPTLVVWDPSALTDVVFFKNAGKPFTYETNEIPLDHVEFAS